MEVNKLSDVQTTGSNAAKADMTTNGQQGLQLLMDYKTALQNGNPSRAQEMLQNLSSWLTVEKTETEKIVVKINR